MATYRLNDEAVKHTRQLIDDGSVDVDTGWSDGKPDPDEGTAEIDEHGYDAYGLWFLGIDPDASEETKGRYHFPVGDFSKIFRQGLIAAEQRAAQNDEDDIARAAKQLLERLDDKRATDEG